MPSVAFKQAKAKGRWFESLVDPILIEMGLEPEDSDNKRYKQKKGYDRLVRIKDKNGVYKRDHYGSRVYSFSKVAYEESMTWRKCKTSNATLSRE